MILFIAVLAAVEALSKNKNNQMTIEESQIWHIEVMVHLLVFCLHYFVQYAVPYK